MIATLLALAALIVLSAVTVAVARGARAGSISRPTLIALSVACAVGLIAMTLTDWPAQSLDAFWAGHSVLSATLSTLLLVGAGFLAFEAQENLQQRELSASLATAAFGGLVDYALDVDLATTLLTGAEQPAGYDPHGKPLRWLRDSRNFLHETNDPRQSAAWQFAQAADDQWRVDICDQAVRRVMAGMRDWSSLLGQTRDGQSVLVLFGKVRNALLTLGVYLQSQRYDEARELGLAIRSQCVVLALGLELGSGVAANHVRAGVLTKAPPLLDAIKQPLRSLLAQAERSRLDDVRASLAKQALLPNAASAASADGASISTHDSAQA